MADLKDLLGTWTMLSWKKETVATGETVDGLGPDPVAARMEGCTPSSCAGIGQHPKRFHLQIRKGYAFSTA